MADPGSRYDSVRYPGKFYPQASIDRLSTLARLQGLQPAAIDGCRVLELGCGDGGLLIPQAERFPGSRFVGVDLSRRAIDDGRALIAELGLRNIELQVADLSDYRVERGGFDYIVSHGVLSWLPLAPRERLLALVGDGLAAQGVAYISYAALPGGYLRNVPRDLMRFHTRQLQDPVQKVAAARAIVKFVSDALPPDSFGEALLQREMAGSEGKDHFLLHDLLADDNEPLYFVDFVAAAAGQGLQFLAEAEAGVARLLPPAVRERLQAMPDRIEREQYLDFIQLRRFRQTLLCRDGQALAPAPLDGLWLRSRSKPLQPDAAPSDDGPLGFEHPAWGRFQVSGRWCQAALRCLSRAWPQALRHEELLRACEQDLGAVPGDAERTALRAFLLDAWAENWLQLQSHALPFNANPPDPLARPRCSPLRRWQAAQQLPLVSRELLAVPLPSPLLRRLVPLLNGSRDPETLLLAMADSLPPAQLERLSPQAVAQALALLARNALLED